MAEFKLSQQSVKKLQRFFEEGKIVFNDFSDSTQEAEDFLEAMGYKPMYGKTSVGFALNKRKEVEHV